MTQSKSNWRILSFVRRLGLVALATLLGATVSARQVPVQGAEPDIALVAKFDRDNDRRLNRAERDAARGYLAAHPELRRPSRGTKPARTGTPGAALAPKDVKTFPPSVSLYDATTIRTLFLQFEAADWEQELDAFYHTDVLLTASLIVEGKT